MTVTTRPENAYILKRDRTRSTRLASPEVTAGFRVHFNHPDDPSNTHRVTKLLWEHEAIATAKALASAGFILMDTPDRPGGIESVHGWGEKYDTPEPLQPFAWHRKKALELGRLFRSEPDTMKKLAIVATFKVKVLDGIPENASVRTELQELFGLGEQDK